MQGFSAISLINSTADEEIRLLNARLQNINIKIKTLLVKTYNLYAARSKLVLRSKRVYILKKPPCYTLALFVNNHKVNFKFIWLWLLTTFVVPFELYGRNFGQLGKAGGKEERGTGPTRGPPTRR
jgi:hypothetical protein